MALPGLKPNVELELAPVARLVERPSGRSISLSETERLLIERWDGAGSATDLSAHVFIEGLDVEPSQVERFFARLSKAGLLHGRAPTVPDFVPAPPGVEVPEDIVPALRGDLIIEEGGETARVTDPLTERAFTLYDHELSIARMLDGKRTAADVLDAANRLGIPATLTTLRTFLQMLKAYRFVDRSVEGGDTTWPKRTAWKPEVRSRYQQALKALREGKPQEALATLSALAPEELAVPELARLRRRLEEGQPTVLEFDALHREETTSDVSTVPSTKTLDDPFESFGFFTSPPTKSRLPAMPDAVVDDDHPTQDVPLSELPADDAQAIQRTSWKGPVLGLVALIIVGWLLHPVDVMTELPCELRVEALGEPKAPKAGAVASTDVAPGDAVVKGGVLARLAEGNSVDQLAARAQELHAQLAKLGDRPPLAAVKKAKTGVLKADAALAALEKKRKRTPKRQLAALEKKIKVKAKAAETAHLAYEAFTHDTERAELTAALQKVTAEKVATEIEQERSRIVAPADGVFLALEPLPQRVIEGETYGQIVAPTFSVVVGTALDPSSTSAIFRSAGKATEVRLQNGVAMLKVVPALVGAKGSLEIDHGSSPWILALLR